MKELIFATGNPNKVREVRALLQDRMLVKSLEDIGFKSDIDEPFDNLRANAEAKASHIANLYGIDCFAEDSGLEVQALKGAPGVHSARYAGPEKNHSNNIDLLLENMKEVENRSAQFRAVICFRQNQESYFFEGIVKGQITKERKGNGGFGYDPIFIPALGDGRSFAEMSIEEKKLISHRGQAMKKFIHYLNQQ